MTSRQVLTKRDEFNCLKVATLANITVNPAGSLHPGYLFFKKSYLFLLSFFISFFNNLFFHLFFSFFIIFFNYLFFVASVLFLYSSIITKQYILFIAGLCVGNTIPKEFRVSLESFKESFFAIMDQRCFHTGMAETPSN